MFLYVRTIVSWMRQKRIQISNQMMSYDKDYF